MNWTNHRIKIWGPSGGSAFTAGKKSIVVGGVDSSSTAKPKATAVNRSNVDSKRNKSGLSAFLKEQREMNRKAAETEAEKGKENTDNDSK